MADAVDMKISQLDAAVSVADADVFPETSGAVSKKVPASVLKNYMNGTNDISALGDGSVTGAILAVKSASESADDDIEDTIAENGAHNLLCHDLVSEIRSGVTMTVNADRSITLSNSNTSGNTILFIASFLINIEAGKTYKMLLDPATGTIPFVYTETTEQYYRDGDTFTASVNERAKFMLRIEEDFTTSSPVTIKPMMTLASDPSTTYAPHAMTNRELTESISSPALVASASVPVTINGTSYGSVVFEKYSNGVKMLSYTSDNLPNDYSGVLCSIPSGFTLNHSLYFGGCSVSDRFRVFKFEHGTDLLKTYAQRDGDNGVYVTYYYV